MRRGSKASRGREIWAALGRTVVASAGRAGACRPANSQPTAAASARGDFGRWTTSTTLTADGDDGEPAASPATVGDNDDDLDGRLDSKSAVLGHHGRRQRPERPSPRRGSARPGACPSWWALAACAAVPTTRERAARRPAFTAGRRPACAVPRFGERAAQRPAFIACAAGGGLRGRRSVRPGTRSVRRAAAACAAVPTFR